MPSKTAQHVKVNTNLSPELDDITDSMIPYRARVTVEGTNTMLMHRWNSEVQEAKAALPRGHEAKKHHDPESMVYRHPETGNVALPGMAFLRAVEEASRFLPPIPGRREHSPRPLVETFVMLAPESEWVDLGCETWDYIDHKRVVLSATRGASDLPRPALNPGWRASLQLDVLNAGLITPVLLRKALDGAGAWIGVGAYRRAYGRFMTIAFDYDLR